MDKLSKEKVMHIADLANLELTDEEVERYGSNLNALFSEMDKVNSVDIDDSVETMFSTSKENMKMFDDEYISSLENEKLINNAPLKYENFIEVEGVFDE